jgi:hypothetical protein
MCEDHASSMRKAIENLISAKLYDMIARPGGLDRLVAHRMTGVASHDVRNAEQQLERVLGELMPGADQDKSRAKNRTGGAIEEPAQEQGQARGVESGRRPIVHAGRHATGQARVPAGV